MRILKLAAGKIFLIGVFLTGSCSALNSRQNPLGSKDGNITCGTQDDLAMQVQVCAQPLMDILEGTIKKWPRNERDAADLCNSFAGAEKCLRRAARQCATGLQRTIISTVAHSVQRARKRECSKSKYQSILKMTQCIEKYQDLVHSVVNNATDHLTVVATKMQDLDRRTSTVCCMVHQIENNFRTLFLPRCEAEATTVIQLYRAVLEDVLDLICRNPKCKDMFRGYDIPKNSQNRGVIFVLVQIIFSLG